MKKKELQNPIWKLIIENLTIFQRRGGGLKIVFRPIPFPASLRSSHFIKIAPSPRPRLPINPWKRYFSAENDISSNKNVLVRPSWNSGVKPCRLVTIRHSSVRCNPGKTWDRVKKSFFPFFFLQLNHHRFDREISCILIWTRQITLNVSLAAGKLVLTR